MSKFHKLRLRGWKKVSVTISTEAFHILIDDELDEEVNDFIISTRGGKNDKEGQ